MDKIGADIAVESWLFEFRPCSRFNFLQARIRGCWVRSPPLGWRDPRRRHRFLRLKGSRKKGHWCLLIGCSTSFKHNMAINILKSCKYVFAYVKNCSSPSHIRSSTPWHPPLAEILDLRLVYPISYTSTHAISRSQSANLQHHL